MDRRAILWGAVSCVGGGLCVVGSLFAWMTISANVGVRVTESSTGLDLSGGWVSLAAGAALLAAAASTVATGGARWAGVSAVLSASAAVGAAAYEWVGIRGDVGEIPSPIADLVDVSIGVGLPMVLAGGLLGLIGGIMSLRGGPSGGPATILPPPVPPPAT